MHELTIADPGPCETDGTTPFVIGLVDTTEREVHAPDPEFEDLVTKLIERHRDALERLAKR